MKHLFLSTLLLISIQSFAQRLNMDWESTPTIHKISNEKFLKESAIIISEKNQLELSKSLNNEIVYTRRIHKIIRVNDEKGIEMYNKIKVGFGENNPITLIKARSISPAGKIVELKPEAFKDIKEENGSSTKIFALEGIEKGSEIEYIVYKRQRFVAFGTEYMQDVMPTMETWFELVSNENLIFELKGYNGTIIEKDTLQNSKNSFLAHTTNLPGLEEEKYASYVSHFARVEYAMAYNLQEKGKDNRLFTWDDIAKNIYKSYTTFSDKEMKEGKKLLDNKEFQNCTDTKSKINWIEHFIKTNIVQQQYVQAEDAEEISFIVKNKLTNEDGIKRLFALLFTIEKIDFEVGYTTDRFTKTFDFNFINPDNLTDCLFYIPAIKQYLAPNETYYRSPLFPANWSGNNSMFTKVVKLGTLVTASAENKKIPAIEAQKNYHNHDVSVTFNADIDTSIIQITNTFQGENMANILPAFILLEKEKRDNAAKEMISVSEKDEKIDNFKYENNDFKNLTVEDKPLKVSATIHATNNIEKAGNKFLFKIGELIGRQSEMYQERERQFDLEIPNAHQYTRKLKVEIPAGYKANNLDKLTMNVVALNNGKESCKFTSSYTLTGNTIDVSVFEIYNENYTPKSVYEDYRKVINTAADFNKIVIVFEKL